MKKIVLLFIAVSTLLSGCMVYETPNHDRGQHQGTRDRDRDGIPDRMERDRDGDGVPNRQDRRPDDSRRF